MAQMDFEEIDIERWDDEKIKHPEEHDIIELEVLHLFSQFELLSIQLL
jgi:hypothetical protein